jgi:MmgE/PrpD N-terminal domain
VTKEQRHLRGDRGLQAFAKTQSKEMKTSIEQARRAATAMESSEGSLEVAKSSLRDTKRAFVYLKDFNMRLDRSVQLGTYGGEVPGPVHGLSLAPIWANSGKTPARRGSLSKRLQPGFAARGAVEAVLLALAGISGAKDVLEGTFGFYPLYEAREYDIAAVIDSLGRHFLGGQARACPQLPRGALIFYDM